MDPVLIAGGGPVGMLAGLLLANFEVPSIILEQRPASDREGSKAICFQRDVLDIFDRVGIADAAVAEGVTWRIARTTFQDQELFHIELPDSGDASLPPFINLSQSRLEVLLEEAVATSPLVDLRRGHAVGEILRGLDEGADRVRIMVDAGGEQFELEGSHLVGADGARSSIRDQIGATFEGHSFDEQFLIADIEADLGFAAERRFHFDPSWNPGRQVLIHQQPHGIWRIDWQVPSDFDLHAEQASGGLDRRIRLITGDRGYRIDWLSVYRFHQRLASRFRVGRVFLAGDAAHLMSPFGARGLNSGAQDAENLAWKLAYAIHGWGGPDLLSSYEVERKAAAEENLRVTDETMRFLVPGDEEGRAARQRTLQAAVTDPAARASVNSGKLAEPFWYTDSPLTSPADDAVRVTPEQGRPTDVVPGVLCRDHPLVDVPDPGIGRGLPAGGSPSRLRRLFGDAMTVLVFGDTKDDSDLRTGATPPPVGPVQVVDGNRLAGVRRTLGVPESCQVVVRPDGHVAAITTDPLLLGTALRRAVGHLR